jgi:Dolichyl-phosphate-mannose-protein mannosyltransferase
MTEIRSQMPESPPRAIARDLDRGAGWRSDDWDLRSVTALILVLLASTVLMIVYHNRFWAPADEGKFAHVAERILRGEALHRDVQDLHAGYINYVNAAAFSLFGVRMVSMRYPLALLTVVQAGLMFLVLKRAGTATALVGGLALTSLSFVQFLNPTPNWYTLFLAVAIIAWLSWNPTSLQWQHIVTGFLIGTAFLFRQLSGVFLASGVLVFLLLQKPSAGATGAPRLARGLLALIAVGHAWYILRVTDPVGWVLFGVWPLAVVLWAWLRTKRSDEEVLVLVRDLTVGSLISAFPLLSYHLAHGALGYWFRDTFVAAISIPTLGFMQRSGYFTLGIASWRGFHSGELDKVINAGLYTCLLLISAVLGFVLFRGLVRGSRASVHPLPVIATFYALVSLHYQVPIYLFYTVGLSLAAVLLLTSESNSSTQRVTIAVSSMIAGVALYYQAAMPVTRPLKDIVAGERRFPTTPLPSRVAGIYVDTADARLYQSLLRLIDRETQPGDTIFALPMNTELYFLGRRTNPFKFYNTAVGIRSTADLDAVLQVIHCHPPKLVFYDSTDKYNTAASVRIARTVRTQYEKLAPVPPFEVFRAASHPSDCGITSRPEQSRR